METSTGKSVELIGTELRKTAGEIRDVEQRLAREKDSFADGGKQEDLSPHDRDAIRRRLDGLRYMRQRLRKKYMDLQDDELDRILAEKRMLVPHMIREMDIELRFGAGAEPDTDIMLRERADIMGHCRDEGVDFFD